MNIHPPRLLSVALAATVLASTSHGADLVAPNATFNWTNENAWSGGTATWTNGDSASFGDISSGRTAQLSNAITAQNLVFSNTNNTWTVAGTGGAITLDGTLTKSGAGTLIIQTSVPLGGNGAVVVDAGELQLLNNTNTFSGGVTLNSGVLRLGVNNGTGNPQTAGSLGTGTFTINGGAFYHSQGNVRSQPVNAVIAGDFTAYFAAGGGLQLGNTAGTRTVDIGAASRIITVGVNADGTGSNAVLSLVGLTNSPGAALIKRGDGILRIQGVSSAPVTVEKGSLEMSGGLGTTAFAMQPDTVWRKTTATALTNGSTMTMTNAMLVNRDTLSNSRTAAFQQFQVSGTNSIFVGSGLSVAEAGVVPVAGINILAGGVLGGNGLLRTAADEVYAGGVTTLSNFSDAAITLGTGPTAVGAIRPGNPDLLDLSIGTLSFGSLVWNAGTTTPAPQMFFNLGSTNASDRIVLSGALTKGSGTTNFVFDFVGTAAAGTFTLMEYASTDFAVGDFTYTNLASGFSGTFQTNATQLQFVVTSSGSPYNNWLTNYPTLTGTNTNTTADPDGDGFDNFTEFAFDGNPAVGSPAFARAAAAGTNATFTFVARLDSLANYVVMSTTNLSTGPWTTNAVTVTNAADQSGVLLTNDYVRRAFTVPVSSREFFRIKAELAP